MTVKELLIAIEGLQNQIRNPSGLGGQESQRIRDENQRFETILRGYKTQFLAEAGISYEDFNKQRELSRIAFSRPVPTTLVASNTEFIQATRSPPISASNYPGIITAVQTTTIPTSINPLILAAGAVALILILK